MVARRRPPRRRRRSRSTPTTPRVRRGRRHHGDGSRHRGADQGRHLAGAAAGSGREQADAEIAAQQLVWTATAAASVAESGAGPPRSRTSGTSSRAAAGQHHLGGPPRRPLFGLAQLDRTADPGMVRYAYLKGYQDPRADVWIGRRHATASTSTAVTSRSPATRCRGADGVVHLVLYRNSRRIFATQLGLGTSEESRFSGRRRNPASGGTGASISTSPRRRHLQAPGLDRHRPGAGAPGSHDPGRQTCARRRPGCACRTS